MHQKVSLTVSRISTLSSPGLAAAFYFLETKNEPKAGLHTV